MMSGKAVSRALCGHFLVEAALVNKLLFQVLPYTANENETVNPSEESEAANEENADLSSDNAILGLQQLLLELPWRQKPLKMKTGQHAMS